MAGAAASSSSALTMMHPCRRVAKNELVVGGGPPRVQRHGNRADLDRAKERRDHFRTVAHHAGARALRGARPSAIFSALPTRLT